MSESKFDGIAPPSPFGEADVPEGVDANVSLERLGTLDASNGTAAFVDEYGNRFPVEAPEIAVAVEIVDGIAQVQSVLIDDVTATAMTDGEVRSETVEMVDEHMRPLAVWLVTNMPGEVDRMSPSETMIDLIIRLLDRLVPKVEQFQNSDTNSRHGKANKNKYGI